jgi:hypothetical protein
MYFSAPPTIMYLLAHPDAAETSSEGRPTGRAVRSDRLRWWTSQKSRSAVTPKDVEQEKCCSTQLARLPAIRA